MNWAETMKISGLSKIVGAVLCVGFAISAGASWYALKELKVNGPLYQKVILGKDLVADILPPPAYIIEAYLEVALLKQSPQTLPATTKKLGELRKDYAERNDYWQKQDLSSDLRKTFLEIAHVPAMRFWEMVEKQYLPAIEKGTPAEVNALFDEITAHYHEHRQGIDAVVKIANQMNSDVEVEAARMETLLTSVMLGSGIACIAAVLLCIFGLSLRLVRPLLSLQAIMSEMAQGNLAVDVPALGRQDEIGAMATAVDTFRNAGLEQRRLETEAEIRRAEIERERQMREEEKISSEHRQVQALQYMADEVERAARKSVAVVVEEMETVSEHIGGMAETANLLKDNSDGVACAAEQALAAMRQTTQSTSQLNVAIQGIFDKVQDASAANAEATQASRVASERIQSLAATVSQIEGFTQVINDIARNTNLLALNAGVEAARSGEHGRGFAVIAQEVKALSEQTANATSQISDLIRAVQAAKDGAMTAVTEISTSIERANVTAQEIGGSLKHQVGAIKEIAHNIEETERAAGDVAERIQNVASAIQAAGARTEEANAICSSVADNIHDLQGELIFSLRTSSEFVNRRKEPRYEVRHMIEVIAGGQRQSVELINISNRGALVVGILGEIGYTVEMCIPGTHDPVIAHVVRKDAKTTSVKFEQPIGVAMVRKHAA